MAPLLLCGFGIVFLILRVTVRGVDLVPDSIGLLLYAAGLWRLAASSKLLIAASTMAGLGAFVALSFLGPDWLSGVGEDTRDVTFGVTVAGALGLGAWALRVRARKVEDHAVVRQLFVLAVTQVVAAAALVGALRDQRPRPRPGGGHHRGRRAADAGRHDLVRRPADHVCRASVGTTR